MQYEKLSNKYVRGFDVVRTGVGNYLSFDKGKIPE